MKTDPLYEKVEATSCRLASPLCDEGNRLPTIWASRVSQRIRRVRSRGGYQVRFRGGGLSRIWITPAS